MSETETPLKRLILDNLSSLKERTTYLIVRSEETEYEKCIYNVLQVPEEKTLTLYTERSSWFLGSSVRYKLQIQDNDRLYYHSDPEKIRLLIPTSQRTLPHYAQVDSRGFRSENARISIGDLNLEQHYFRYLNNSLTKRDSKFYFQVAGAEFDPIKLYSEDHYDSEEIASLLHCSSNLLSQYSIKSGLESKEAYNLYLQNFGFDIVLDIEVNSKDGIAKTLNKVLPFYEDLRKRDYFGAITFKVIVERAYRTVNSVKFSTVINKIFGEVASQEEFDRKVEEISVFIRKDEHCFYKYDDFRDLIQKIIDSQPDAREVKKAALKRKSSGAFNKIMDDLDFVKIDQKTHPLTHEAVHGGDLPLGTFFRKNGESYFVYNDNWDLWEEMLALHPEIAKTIAAEASRRTTYEKDLMSYFYFVLHSLPEYLEKHTGKKWTGVPKLVTSSNELEPPKEGSNGVAKTRSALTPIVDNEKNIITVPYVSMQIGGYQTTYCYGLDYVILDKGYSFQGNVVTKSVEKELNGRDDYGLMFYTLTGSSEGRGYPTFLIIFERLENSTRVHFHRTHPMRSKSGDYNPIHSWTQGCYKWMIGNVNFERIKAQQGDLAFVEIDKFPEGEVTEVNSYDSHCFSTPVKFTPYTKKDKQNVLGYVNLESDTELKHTEHRNRVIPAGTYEIRQCRSWEANPVGIWSLRID